ncbi:hypothetical protein [Streptomyces sp. NBC_01768]|uniref:hypothetical protein n=1 Tax=Streptomyces sp. NBC_01768 TaxID=2975938 RepID=UPI002DDB743F|nr:hypothetical protein [Streptomyces sp. NBC_01768]WSC31839.1 hypothetical protein OG902_36905 [Streptomyces sp. NBC_01768]
MTYSIRLRDGSGTEYTGRAWETIARRVWGASAEIRDEGRVDATSDVRLAKIVVPNRKMSFDDPVFDVVAGVTLWRE